MVIPLGRPDGHSSRLITGDGGSSRDLCEQVGRGIIMDP